MQIEEHLLSGENITPFFVNESHYILHISLCWFYSGYSEVSCYGEGVWHRKVRVHGGDAKAEPAATAEREQQVRVPVLESAFKCKVRSL